MPPHSTHFPDPSRAVMLVTNGEAHVLEQTGLQTSGPSLLGLRGLDKALTFSKPAFLIYEVESMKWSFVFKTG